MDKKQSSKQGSDKGLIKDGRSRRARAGRVGRQSGVPRIMILAGLVVVAGAAWLYWPAGNSTPTGLGEQHTVVSSEPADTVGGGVPGSGEVDINEHAETITPEQPEPGAQQAETTALPAEPEAGKPEKKPVVSKPKPRPAPPPDPVLPGPDGSYAVQTGSFGEAGNADKEVMRLKELGWDTRIRAGDNSAGQMVFRVWITYFSSRAKAQTFIDQNAKHIPGAIAVHR